MRSRSELDPSDLLLLRALATGTLPSKTLLNAELLCLEAEGLIDAVGEALPTLTPRGRLLLQVANGECAPPLD